MKSTKGWVVILAIILIGSISAMAQTQPNLLNGIPPQGSYDGSNADTVNLLNGNVALHIPLPVATPQRGKLAIKYYLVTNSKTWQAMSPDNQWRPSYDCSIGGPCGQGPVFVSTASFTMTRSYSEEWGDGIPHTYSVSPPETLVTWDGASHPFAIGATGLETADTSRYNVQISGSDANGLPYNGVVTDANGTQYSGTFTQDISTCVTDPGNGLPGWTATRNCNEHFSVTSVTDANGNVLTAPMGIPDIGGVFGTPSVPTHQAVGSESTGCQTALGTPWVAYLNYPAPNGQTNQIKLCFAPFPKLSTNFSPAGIHQYQYLFNNNPSSQPVPIFLSNVILPDNTQWSINYDTYGEITSVTTPTTATMQYAWAEGSYPICSNADITTVSRAVHKRTLTDVNGNAFSWTYQWGAQASDGTISHTVTDPLGNDTVHVFKSIAQQNFVVCNFLEISTRTYQGPLASAQQLKQVDTAYLVPVDYNNVVPQDETTTIFPSGKVNKVHTDYDQGFGSGTSATLGLPTAQKTYDWGPTAPGALLQEVDTAYLWQSDSRYVAAHLLSLPASTTTKDGSGCKMAETDYTYDEAAYLTNYEGTVGALPAGTHVAAPNAVRGNPTSTTRQQFAGNACPTTPQAGPTSHVNWYDTGEVSKQIDPLGNITTHSYDLAYAGALPTKTCNAKSQCMSATYDANSGLVTSFTDVNGSYQASGNTPGDPAHTSTYSYDFMLRLTSALAPPDPDPANNRARAQTTLTYSTANTLPLSVQQQTSVTTALTDTATSYLDGLGHTYQSQHVVTGGIVTVNTTFDGLGHAVTVTNPFFTTSDSTYGVTSSQYDALGRVTQGTRQDGSIGTASYTDNCTTATDEAGKPRKICSDALGRLIEVDEPQASDPGTNATASVTVSGSIESVVNGSVVTAASGTRIVMAQANDLYFQGSNQHIYELFNWSGGNWAGGWHNVDLTAATGAPTWSGTTLFGYYDSGHSVSNVLYQSADLHLRHFWCCQSGNWVADDTTALAPFAVSGTANTPIAMAQANDLYYLGSNGNVQELHNWSGGSSPSTWGAYDLSGNLGAPQFSGNTLLATFDASHSVTNVLYQSSNQHIRHFWCCGSSGWTADDLTSLAASAVPETANTAIANAQTNDLYYLGSNGNVQETYNWSGGGSPTTWGAYDLSGNLGAPQFSGNTVSAYFDVSHWVTNVLYQSSTQHIRHFWCCGSSGWVADDLTSLATGGGTAAANTPILVTQTNDLYYLGSDQHVHELYNWSGGNSPTNWHSTDLMALTGAPNWSGTTFFGYYDSAHGITNIVYSGSDSHLHHLWCCQSGSWVADDLSVAAASTFDSGTVTLTVGGFTVTTCFGNSTNSACTGQPVNITPAQVATALAQALNVSASPVTASVSGSAINMTWKTAGPFTPPVASLVTMHDQPGVFSSPSFTSPAANFSGGAGPSLTNNPYVTLYSYDALGNLLRVDQKGTAPSDSTKWRTRTFTYNSLSQLVTANNPESGTISYVYDADGNLLQKTSPAPNQIGSATQTISYCYEPLNRVAAKAYSAQSGCPSPVATYTYDVGTNAIGHLSSFTDQAGSGSYVYDTLGRITSEQRTINGVTKALSYGYHLNSSIKAITYPSGAVVTYTPDLAGRMISAIDAVNSINYVTSATYGPSGALTGFISGNSTNFVGVTNSFNFNKRLQPVTMSATTPTATVFSLTYDFHLGNGTSGSDNGNVWGITNNKDATRNQTFTYDALNRLASAQNSGTDCSVTVLNGKTKFWGNSYSYDAWGNLLTKTGTKCTPENLTLISNPQNRADNGNQNPALNYEYDAAGNMTLDQTDLVTATYDAENRVATATKNSATTTYVYDSDGNRVEKTATGSGMLYWYMTPGIVGESDLSGNLKTEYVFFDGERVARRDFPTGNVSYYFSDRLRSTSIITDGSGTILDEYDYYPWGGEIQLSNGLDNHYKFTGKERDSETGLDYFGARHYSNGLGRFITPDWAAKPTSVPYAQFGDPQSLNLYSYVGNNPIGRIDPDGHGFDDPFGIFGGGLMTQSMINRQRAYQTGLVVGNAIGLAGQMMVAQPGQNVVDHMKFEAACAASWACRLGRWYAGVKQKVLCTIFCQDPNVIAADPFVNPTGRPMMIDPEKWVRVGRWMSVEELEKMKRDGKVVESRSNGVTSVTVPPNASAYRDAPSGSVFVTFYVATESVRALTDNGWAKIYGPSSLFGVHEGIKDMPEFRDLEIPELPEITIPK